MPMQQFQVRAAEAVGQMSTEATVAAAVRENVISEVAGPRRAVQEGQST